MNGGAPHVLTPQALSYLRQTPISGASHSTILFLVAHRLFSVPFLQCLEPCIRQNDYRCSLCFIYFIYFVLLYIYNVILICLQYLWIIKNIYCMSDSRGRFMHTVSRKQFDMMYDYIPLIIFLWNFSDIQLINIMVNWT